MTFCDMCGHEGPVQEAIVEGSMLSVCDKCGEHGKMIPVTKPSPLFGMKPKTKEQKNRVPPEIKEIIVEDYGSKIKKAREANKLKQEELAADIKEKVSVIHKLESNQYTPTLILARKLEKHLHIQLVENYTQKKSTDKVNLQNKDLTIGDLLNAKQNK